MKVRLTFTMIMLFSLSTIYGQLFQKNYTIPGENFHDVNIVKLEDGTNDLITAGAIFDGSYANPEICLFRIDDADGSAVYQGTYTPTTNGVKNPRLFDAVRFIENNDEMIAITGSVELNGKIQLAIIKVKAIDGSFVAGAFYANMVQNLEHSQGLHIIYTQQNNQYGFVVGGFANQDYYETTSDEHVGFVMRTDLNLATLWTTSLFTTHTNANYDYDMVNHITETDDGYFITGSCTGVDLQGTKQAVLAVRLSNSGSMLWQQSYIYGNSRDVGVDAYYDAAADEIFLLANYSQSHYFGITVFDDNTGNIDFSRTWLAFDWNDLDKYAFTITKSETDINNLVISGYDRDASWYDENGNYITGQTVPFVYEFEKATGTQKGSSYLYHIPYIHPAGFSDYFNFWNSQMPLIYYPDISVTSLQSTINYYNVAYRNDSGSGIVNLELIETDSDHKNECESDTKDFNHQTIQVNNVPVDAGQLSPNRLNLAMQKTNYGYEIDSCNTTTPQGDLDFGDAPDDTTGLLQYSTLLANNGARHLINPAIYLGSFVDGEADGQPGFGADCDDNDCVYPSLGDDEDGVTLPLTTTPGAIIPITVVASVDGFLDVWMDFNINGNWTDAGEHVYITQSVVAGANALSINVPATASYGQSYLRFRFRDNQNPISYNGFVQNGEVEDYMIYIMDDPQGDLDFGDAPEEPGLYNYPTTLMNNGARHIINPDIFLGTRIDNEADGQPSFGADCDDNDCVYPSLGDDEDGVMMPAVVLSGAVLTMDVTASVTGYLDVWFDLNIDGDWADAGEHIFASLPISGGLNTISYTVPATLSSGQSYMRFRFRDYSSPLTFDGLAQNGEVEDYKIQIQGSQTDLFDFGDAPDDPYPTLLANDGARHFNDGVTFLGTLIDTEPDGQPGADALCDDTDCMYVALGDDEDGVTFVTKMRKGRLARVDVVASVDGYLNAWIDFNKNGSWADAGEQVFVDLPVGTGVNNLTFTVPMAARRGLTYIRFRFATFTGLSFDGLAQNGEVEDYRVRIFPRWLPVITNITHVLALPQDIWPIAPGDVIGVFHTNLQGVEECAGLLEMGENRNEVMVAFGDDPTTPDIKEGFAEGEEIRWKVFSFNSEKEHDLTMEYNPALPNSDGTFAENGISAVTEISGINVVASPTQIAICEGSIVQLFASATGGSWEYTFSWTSLPEGFASNIKNPVVQPLENTSYIVEAFDGLFYASDTVNISVSPKPYANAGDDDAICGTQPYPLSGTAYNYSSIMWSTTGDGNFDDITSLAATYTPGDGDMQAGAVHLLLMALPLSGCQATAVDSLTLTLENVQAIPLSSGWQGISSYLSLITKNIEEIMEPVSDNLVMMYNASGIYWPEQQINTLDQWDDYDAFATKLSSEDTLYICGSSLSDLSMELNNNWNFIPVLCETGAPVEDVFGTLNGMVLVKEIGGIGIYWPSYNINTLQNLVSGKAYLGFSSQGGEISYFGNCSEGTIKSAKVETESPWNEISCSPQTHTVAILPSAVSELRDGDIIGAFTPKGWCAGITVVENGSLALSLNGDDALTTDADGFQSGETIGYKVFRPSTGEEFGLEVSYVDELDNSGTYVNNGMSVISSLKISATGFDEADLNSLNIYPNPTSGMITIYGLESRADVILTNTMGEVIHSTSIMPTERIDLNYLPAGVYVVIIKTERGSTVNKLVKE